MTKTVPITFETCESCPCIQWYHMGIADPVCGHVEGPGKLVENDELHPDCPLEDDPE